jgi:DNA-binding PadR family transcriptional regulator
MARRLGENQSYALKALAEHNGGTWYPGSGWVWTNVSTTLRLLDGLVRRGLATRVEKTRMVGTRREPYPFYEITEEGRKEVG